MQQNKKRVFSGIQPSGNLHLGNYLGAINNWVRMQEEYDNYFCIVDLHALTVPQDPEELKRKVREVAAVYLASGLDPERCVIFRQSRVSEHTELSWLLNCVARYGELSRMTQFKDKAQKGGAEVASAGLFDYPVLMAADILLYAADQVPVGEDQRQHLELSRDLAQRFNRRFGETFVVPEPFILKETAKIYDLQEPAAKMSKSAGSGAGLIDLLEPPTSIAKKIRSALTDTERDIRFDPATKPGVSNLLMLQSVLSDRSVAELEEAYAGRGYGDLKKELAEVVVAFVEPVQRRTNEILADPAELDRLLARGAARARAVATPMLATAYDRVGFLPPAGAGPGPV
ncbi:MAG: tryptophan--tRNA ligase [Mycobacteriales bacterium]